jgi:hypothetical protein
LTAQGTPNIRTVDASTPRELQIALALSAAPHEVSESATIFVLGKHGYQKVRDGSNGFTCAIDREHVNTVEPECFDGEGTKSIFQTRLRTEELRAMGKSEKEIEADIEQGYRTGRFHAPAKPGIVYMLSDQNRVFDPETNRIISFPGHLMFYAPYATAKDLGYNSEASLPYLVHPGKPDALMIVIPQSGTSHH